MHRARSAVNSWRFMACALAVDPARRHLFSHGRLPQGKLERELERRRALRKAGCQLGD